jgi:hypothetical protein
MISIITFNLAGMIPLFMLVKPFIALKSSRNFWQTVKSWNSISIYLFILQFIYIYRLPASYVLSVEDLAKISISLSLVFIGMPLIQIGGQYFRQAGRNFVKTDTMSLSIPIQVLLALAMISFGLFFSSDFLVSFFLGASYLDCVFQIRLLAFGVPFFAIAVFAVSFKLGRNDKNVPALCIFYTIINFGFIIFFCELIGSQSIAFIVLGEMIYAGIGGFFVLRSQLNFKAKRF